jgi:hypothetical protein
MEMTQKISLYAESFRKATIAIRDFAKAEVIPILLAQVDERQFEVALSGLYYRMVLWCDTLCDLNDSSHFQAARAGARAAFELHLEIHLLARDPSLAEKMFAFTKVWKYHSALKIYNFTESHPEVDRQQFRHQLALVEDAESKKQYEELVARFWPSRRGKEAPQHWSGKSTYDLAREAGLEFELRYRRDYGLDSVFTHAGILPIYNISRDSLVNAYGRGHRLFQESFLKATEIVCTTFHVFEAVPGLRNRFTGLFILPIVNLDRSLKELADEGMGGASPSSGSDPTPA